MRTDEKVSLTRRRGRRKYAGERSERRRSGEANLIIRPRCKSSRKGAVFVSAEGR